MTSFISYSTHDKFVAAEIAKALKTLRIQAFLAHDDLSISQSWRTRILNELASCDIFVPLLSKDFKASDWCAMECGYVLSRSIPILPLSIDGTWPYGFLSAIQGGFIDISVDLSPGRLISVIRSALIEHHFEFSFSSFLDGLDRSVTASTLGGRLREIDAFLSGRGPQETVRVLDVLERRSKLIRSDGRLRATVQRIYEITFSHLTEQDIERFETLLSRHSAAKRSQP